MISRAFVKKKKYFVEEEKDEEKKMRIGIIIDELIVNAIYTFLNKSFFSYWTKKKVVNILQQFNVNSFESVDDPVRIIFIGIDGEHVVLNETWKSLLANALSYVAHQTQLKGDVVNGEQMTSDGFHCHQVMKISSGVSFTGGTIAGFVNRFHIVGVISLA